MSMPEPAEPEAAFEPAVPPPVAAPGDHSMIRNYSIVIALTLVSNVFGFVKEILTARYFGISSQVDAFVVAFALVSIIPLVFAAGPLQSAFIPLFTRRREQGEVAWEFFSRVTNLIAVFSVVVTAALYIVLTWSPSVLGLVAPGFTQAGVAHLREYTTWLLATIVLTSVGVVFISVLQVFGNFSAAALPPVLNNLVIIVAMAAFSRWVGIYSLVAGTMAGALLGFLWLLWAVRRYRPAYRVTLALGADIKEFGVFLLPMGVLIFIDQLNALIQKTIVSSTGSGNIAALNYAYKLVGIPIGLFGMSFATVIFPTLALLISQKSRDDALVKEKITNGLNFLVYVLVPTTVFLMAFCVPVVRVVFQGGAFSAEATSKTAEALRIYALGIAGQTLIVYFHRICFACGDSSGPLKIGIVNALFHLLWCILFVRWFGYLGIPLATTVYAYLYCAMLLVFILSRHVRFGLGPSVRLLARTAAVSSAAALAAYAFQSATGGGSKYAVAGTTAVFAAVFLGVSYLFRMQETMVFIDVCRGYLRRGRPKG
jgi:putative peptidoglycan lipid II flippase